MYSQSFTQCPEPAMTRREFGGNLLRGLGGAALATTFHPLSALASAGAASGAGRKPNIILVLSDQHAYKYCGFMGHPVVRTPNLDKIAARGVVFRNTYCGSPVSAPSRAGMISGVYPSDCNSFCNSTAWDGGIPAWPALMRDAGYHTFGTGKMDAHDNFDLGFVESMNINNSHWKKPDITSLFRRPLCIRPAARNQVDGRPRATPHRDAQVVKATEAFIRRQRGGGKPWVAYCGAHAPHDPFTGLGKYYDYYLARADMPEVADEELERQHIVFTQMRYHKNLGTPIPAERVRRARAGYYAMITELDGHIGRLWTALEETGQLEHTIFVYTSDHGESLGEHGLWLKNNLYDVAARIPMVVAGANLPRGVTVDTPVAHVDLIRTFLEWGGAETHDRLRGHSLAPLMRGRAGGHPGWAYSESHSEGNCTGSFMVRKGDWKYIHFTWYDGLLYNLAEDPGELRNRIADPAARDALRELREILHAEVDPVALTEKAFRLQRERLDGLASTRNEEQMLDLLRGRLGEGQAVALLSAYYGHTFAYIPEGPERR
jgi:choline-sulfatase